MSSTYGENLHLTIFGQSHSPAIGVTVEGIPAGEKVDLDELQRFLNRRAPGKNAWSTPRKEADAPEILSGLVNGYTCGAPLTAIIRNTNTRSQDYANLAVTPRPGHADYTAEVKYGGYQDRAGGGHFSGRLTAPLCIAGGICLQILAREEQSVNLQTMVPEKMAVTGRHDPCIVPRAVPCVEAAAAIAVYDAYLSRKREMR